MMEQTTTEPRPRFEWLTAEVLIYGAILILALGLRLARLDTRIMDIPEAQNALHAWELAHGVHPPAASSPLLLTGQALLFALFGAGDAVARLLPALAGSAMVLCPYLLRAHLGRWGALGASLVLAVSPTLVYVAREGSGVGLLVPAVLGLVTLWLAFTQDRPVAASRVKQSPDTNTILPPDRRHLAGPIAIAILGAFALIADPRVLGVILVLAAAWAAERYLLDRDSIATGAPLPWRLMAIVFGAALLLGATAMTYHLEGLAAWVEFPAAWVAHMAPVVNGQPWHYPLGALLLYEPLLVVMGLLGAIDMVARRSRGTVLVWMALGALILALLAGGRDAGDVALVTAFLALPTGRALGSLVENWRSESRLGREGVYSLAALGVVVFVILQASFYSFALLRNMEQADRFLWFFMLAVALIVILVGLAWAWHGAEVTWRVGGAVAALVLLLGSFSTAVSLNFYHPNDPRETHVRVASDEGLRTALEVLRSVSYHESGSPTAAPVTLQAGLGPVWLWYLRDWEEVNVVESLSAGVMTPIVISSAEEPRLALGERYIGHDFVTRSWWQPEQLVSNDQLSWWLYRETVLEPVPLQQVVLWMRVQAQTAEID